MKKLTIVILTVVFTCQCLNAQNLKLKPRKSNALTGATFSKSISDTSLTLVQRENLIFEQIKSGNVPDFLRKLTAIKDSIYLDGLGYTQISYFVLPDYFCIGSNDDFFYMPMTPILAQKLADLTKCSLPTKKMVDVIYKNASIKLKPQPILPTKAMTTLPIFIAHNDSVQTQLKPFLLQQHNSELTAGNKKDIIISNKIYTEKTAKVVIYGWHKLDGKAIQPVYNKHANTWADYSHGIRLVQQKVIINGKKTSLAKVLTDQMLSKLISDEGVITKAYYPIFNVY
jgi:hypothetical protein